MTEVLEWKKIRDQFCDGLLLGNGASIAVSGTFRYSSLYEKAKEFNHLSQEAVGIFQAFGTTDFEFVLRRLWQAKLVNQVLEIENNKLVNAYNEVRNSLIATVRDSHITYEEAIPHLPPIYNFMSRFRTVLSLNYDLVVYWALMAGNEKLGTWFKDAFYRNIFRENWEEVREPYGAEGATLVFYPHGNLVLARKENREEVKLGARGAALLDMVLSKWEDGSVIPIFVSEGTSEQKQLSIESSSYTQRIFREVIPSLGDTLVIYGWSASEQDRHILNQIAIAGIKKVAFSIYEKDLVYIERVKQSFKNIGIENLQFYDASSLGCWIHPEEQKS